MKDFYPELIVIVFFLALFVASWVFRQLKTAFVLEPWIRRLLSFDAGEVRDGWGYFRKGYPDDILVVGHQWGGSCEIIKLSLYRSDRLVREITIKCYQPFQNGGYDILTKEGKRSTFLSSESGYWTYCRRTRDYLRHLVHRMVPPTYQYLNTEHQPLPLRDRSGWVSVSFPQCA